MKHRYKTVELIVEEAAWEPQPTPETAMAVRVAADERTLQQQVKQAGGSGIAAQGVELELRARRSPWPAGARDRPLGRAESKMAPWRLSRIYLLVDGIYLLVDGIYLPVDIYAA